MIILHEPTVIGAALIETVHGTPVKTDTPSLLYWDIKI
jgi:hypothetical protein